MSHYAACSLIYLPSAPQCVVYVDGSPLPPSAPPLLLQHGARLGTDPPPPLSLPLLSYHAISAGFGEYAEFKVCLPWEAARNRALGAAGDAHTPKRSMRERSSGRASMTVFLPGYSVIFRRWYRPAAAGQVFNNRRHQKVMFPRIPSTSML